MLAVPRHYRSVYCIEAFRVLYVHLEIVGLCRYTGCTDIGLQRVVLLGRVMRYVRNHFSPS